MKTAVNLLIFVVIFFGIYGAFDLVSTEYQYGNICPKILGIPACYIILGCLILTLLSHTRWLKDRNILYYLGAGLAWIMATVGSIKQLAGLLECPKTAGGIPMCFISFGIFTSLLLLKWGVEKYQS